MMANPVQIQVPMTIDRVMDAAVNEIKKMTQNMAKDAVRGACFGWMTAVSLTSTAWIISAKRESMVLKYFLEQNCDLGVCQQSVLPFKRYPVMLAIPIGCGAATIVGGCMGLVYGIGRTIFGSCG